MHVIIRIMYGYVSKVSAEPLHKELVGFAEYVQEGSKKLTRLEIRETVRLILECHGVAL